MLLSSLGLHLLPVQFQLLLGEALHLIHVIVSALLDTLHIRQHVTGVVTLFTLHICLETVVVLNVSEDLLHLLVGLCLLSVKTVRGKFGVSESSPELAFEVLL